MKITHISAFDIDAELIGFTEQTLALGAHQITIGYTMQPTSRNN